MATESEQWGRPKAPPPVNETVWLMLFLAGAAIFAIIGFIDTSF